MNTATSPDDHLPESENSGQTSPPQTEAGDSRKIWMRLLFMVIFALLYGVSRVVVSAVIVLQFFWTLFNRKSNEQLRKLGLSLATYTYEILCFLTFNTDARPFPVDNDWPQGAAGEEGADDLQPS